MTHLALEVYPTMPPKNAHFPPMYAPPCLPRSMPHLAPRVCPCRVGYLCRDAERVTDLRLASAELSEQLSDGHGLHPAPQQLVQLRGPGAHLNTAWSNNIWIA